MARYTHTTHLRQLCCVVLFGLGACLAVLPAAEGVTADSLTIGQCAALSGPAQGLGQGIHLGLQVRLAEVNAAGGVHGRRLRLIAVDDGYEPDRCIDSTLRLIEEEGVFCLAGYVGTPTSKVAVPIVADYEVPLVGLFTGAGFLRDPEQPWFPWVINLRASYDEETEALVERLTSDLGVQRIAVFYQDDSFGRVGLEGTIAALERRDMSLVGSGTYTRNTVAVKSGLVDIAEARPEAVIMVGAYQPLAAFVQAARETDLDAVFCTISFVGTENLIDALGPAAEGLVISQVVPSPTRSELPVAQAFRRALAAHDPGAEPTYVAFEGYLNGSLLVSGLEAAGAEPTRAGLMQAYQDMGDLELGGLSMSLAPEDHQGMDTVYITRVDEGVAVPVERLTP